MRQVDVQGYAVTSDVVTAQPFYYWCESTVVDRRQEAVPGNKPVASAHQNKGEDDDDDDGEDEMIQICNLNESVLRLEEMAQKKRMTFKLSNDGINGLNALYEELLELSSRSTVLKQECSRMTPCRLTTAAARGFPGLKSEDVDTLDERTLIQLVHDFGLENIEELPVLQTEALSNYI